MRTYIHSPANVASVRKRVPRRRPHRQLAIAAPTAGAEKAPPCVSARWDVSPTFGLGEGHGSLDVLVGMNRTRHPRLRTSTIDIDSRPTSKPGEHRGSRQAGRGILIHLWRRPNRFAIVDNGSGGARCMRASSLRIR